jgi:hypothetical protein
MCCDNDSNTTAAAQLPQKLLDGQRT